MNQVYHLVRISILDPGEATKLLLSQGWNLTSAAMILTAATCVSTILAFIPNPNISEEVRAGGLMFSPISTAIIVLMSSYLAAFFLFLAVDLGLAAMQILVKYYPLWPGLKFCR
jgi:hypothetical protein